MAPRRLEEAMLDPEDCGRLSSPNVGRRIGSCSSGVTIIHPCLLRGTVVPEYQTRQNHTPGAFQLLQWKHNHLPSDGGNETLAIFCIAPTLRVVMALHFYPDATVLVTYTGLVWRVRTWVFGPPESR